jgi:hypothetical protein
METKSPFYVVQEFISPMLCEDLIDLCDYNVPDQDKDGNWIKTVKTSETAEGIIYERLLLLLPELQAYYQFLYKGTERVSFEWFPQDSQGIAASENSEFLRGKWLKTRARDFTGVLFLSEYQDTPPFEEEFEVYGGKLEFPQHKFGFNPKRGTLVLFPSDPHFINITSGVFAGDLYQARLQIAAQTPYIYNPQKFPGNYTTWFRSLL